MKFPTFNRSKAMRALTTTSSATWLGMGAPGVPMVEGDSSEYSLGRLVAGFPDEARLQAGSQPDESNDRRSPAVDAPKPRTLGASRGLEAWERDLE